MSRARFHDASGTGALGTPGSGVAARVSYAGYYYDLADRLTASVDVGTNVGTAWTRPGTVPSGTGTVLVTATGYATDAVQTVALTGGPTGGTFTLSFGGFTTGTIAYNASAAAVDAALEGLTSVGSGNVAVTAAPGGTGWEVRFTGALADTYQVALTGSGAGLTGGTSPAVAVATVNAGGDAGRAAEVVDTLGRVHRTYADPLGRTVRAVTNFTDGVVSDGDDKTTGYTYNAAGLTSLTAYLTGGGGQTTAYIYGVTQSGSAIDSNDVVGATQWPDPTTGAASSGQQETTTVNALGQTLTVTDRNGNVHTLTYDVLGRVVSDVVTTLGSGVDGTVRRIETAYDEQGNAYLITSYDAASSGNVVNQVQRAFNGLGQMLTEWQAHGSAVNTSTSPKVQYVYSEMPSGANHSRLTSITYPDGYVLTYNYASGLNGDISRLSSLTDSGNTLESYDYLGAYTVVRRAHAQPGVDLTYIKRTGESNADAGDQYIGLDRFGRVADQRWAVASSGTARERTQHTYDAASNRLTRTNVVNSSFDESYTYDNLDQLANFARGSHTQVWDYDALGNWDSLTTDGGSPQTRAANKQNEITSISGATTPTYDANGNMTGDETGKQFVSDAWNRLVVVKNSGGTTLKTYAYDGLNRRVSETASGTTRDLYYSADWQVLEERVSCTTRVRCVWSPVYVDAMVLRDRDSDNNGSLDERLYAVQDANWNVTALLDTSGNVVERYAYDPFGVATVMNASWSALGSSAYAWVHLHQGGRFDNTSGLYHFRNRDYSPTLGRWVGLDPIRYVAGDVNLYRVQDDNPVNQVDPLGLDGVAVPLIPPSAEWPKPPGSGIAALPNTAGLQPATSWGPYGPLPGVPSKLHLAVQYQADLATVIVAAAMVAPQTAYTPPTGKPPVGTLASLTPAAVLPNPPHLEPYSPHGGLLFPNLKPDMYAITAPASEKYNCHTFVMGKLDTWKVPSKEEGWDGTVQGAINYFTDPKRGYQVSKNCEHVAGKTKIAIFGTPDGRLKHSAIELAGHPGWWESKMGPNERIVHRLKDLEGVPGRGYGFVHVCLEK